MNNGHYCDNCEHYLQEEDYDERGGWSYTCPECGFRYRHCSDLTAREQVEKFNNEEQEQP